MHVIARSWPSKVAIIGPSWSHSATPRQSARDHRFNWYLRNQVRNTVDPIELVGQRWDNLTLSGVGRQIAPFGHGFRVALARSPARSRADSLRAGASCIGLFIPRCLLRSSVFKPFSDTRHYGCKHPFIPIRYVYRIFDDLV